MNNHIPIIFEKIKRNNYLNKILHKD